MGEEQRKDSGEFMNVCVVDFSVVKLFFLSCELSMAVGRDFDASNQCVAHATGCEKA